jgi:hypothetical protein
VHKLGFAPNCIARCEEGTMNGQRYSRVIQRRDTLVLPPSAKTVSQDEIDALEAKRIRRLRELGDWRPSNGWQVEPGLAPPICAEASCNA